MNVSLTDKQEKYIAAQIESGDFQNASEVVREALRLHELYRDRVVADLRTAIAAGWDERISTRNVADIVKARTKAHRVR